MKTCSTCKRQLPRAEFYAHARSADGLQSSCKTCQRERNARPHFKRWRNIKDRVFKESHKEHRNYGGRGITMHPEWVDSYEAFRDYIERELGPCPPEHTLDRIDNDGHYVPGNLRWATPMVQTHNRRVSACKEERKAA
jgi:hypothetical protein